MKVITLPLALLTAAIAALPFATPVQAGGCNFFDITCSSSGINRGLTQLDPTSSNSAASRVTRHMDFTDPNSFLSRTGQRIDPTNPNTVPGRLLPYAGAAAGAYYGGPQGAAAGYQLGNVITGQPSASGMPFLPGNLQQPAQGYGGQNPYAPGAYMGGYASGAGTPNTWLPGQSPAADPQAFLRGLMQQYPSLGMPAGGAYAGPR